MAKQAVKQHLKRKQPAGLSCPNDGKEMKLVMVLNQGRAKGPMYWTCDCGYRQLKIRGDNSAQQR